MASELVAHLPSGDKVIIAGSTHWLGYLGYKYLVVRFRLCIDNRGRNLFFIISSS